jgi:hypothetical protein
MAKPVAKGGEGEISTLCALNSILNLDFGILNRNFAILFSDFS